MNRMPTGVASCALGLLVLASIASRALGAEPAKSAAPAGAQVVLSDQSPWRWHITLRKPTVPVERMKAAGKDVSAPVPLAIVKLHGGRSTPDIEKLDSPPPPADWTKPEFNDSDWPRSRGPFGDAGICVGTLCLRGRFTVTDPAAVKSLQLAMKYRGGAIVYLNGREVARAGLPAGQVGLTAPAEPYPDEAWVGADGKMLPIPRADRRGMTEDDIARIARRNRALEPIEVPAAALVKGVNVLAIEVHRSDYHPVAIAWWQGANLVQGITKQWTPGGLLDFSLSAAGAGIVPNFDRPSGLQAWSGDLNAGLDDIGYEDPQDAPRLLIISGARNGVFSGLAGISGPATIRKAKAEIGELAMAGGKGTIPASAVQVRYVLEGPVGAEQISGGGGTVTLFNGLTEQPPAEVAPKARPLSTMRESGRIPMAQPAAMLPVLVTVRVPATAAPGDYEGTLRLSAEGLAEVKVPVRLHVADWAVPSPRDFRTRVGLFQSPTTLAYRYNVPEWSEEHWKLMDKSFVLLAELGGTLVNIPLVDKTQFGNDEGMVYWLRQADGSYKYDFTVFDRYLKLVKKHLGTPKYVALHLWHPGTWHNRPLDSENTVTVVGADGKREHVQVPRFGTEESKRFWKPVLDECRARLAREGLDKSMCLGILCDATAQPEVFKQFDEIWAGGGPAGWTRGCHSTTFESKPYGLKGGGACVYHEFCYGLGLDDPDKKFPPIHAMTGPGTAWFRGEYDWRLPPWIYRTMAERGLYCRTSGVGRMGLDLWSVPVDRAGGKAKSYCIFNRWPNSSVGGHGDPTLSALADPGPDGARSSVRLEIFREGVQEAEAAIVLSDAMTNSAAQIGPELTARCKALLVERINVCRATQGVTEEFYAGWQDRAARLFAAAAEVSAKLGGKK
ncbi:MAG TPA: hypothetical protein PK280_16275 [Planctomycetota bacterium]|nr:hypothetical protein [Planctomycetota bacterium]